MSFNDAKKDHPTEVVKCIMAHEVGRRHKTWAKNTLRSQRRNLRRLNFMCGVDKAFHLNIRRVKRRKGSSRNTRNTKVKLREKFGVRIPNNLKEALMLDKVNNNTK